MARLGKKNFKPKRFDSLCLSFYTTEDDCCIYSKSSIWFLSFLVRVSLAWIYVIMISTKVLSYQSISSKMKTSIWDVQQQLSRDISPSNQLLKNAWSINYIHRIIMTYTQTYVSADDGLKKAIKPSFWIILVWRNYLILYPPLKLINFHTPPTFIICIATVVAQYIFLITVLMPLDWYAITYDNTVYIL